MEEKGGRTIKTTQGFSLTQKPLITQSLVCTVQRLYTSESQQSKHVRMISHNRDTRLHHKYKSMKALNKYGIYSITNTQTKTQKEIVASASCCFKQRSCESLQNIRMTTIVPIAVKINHTYWHYGTFKKALQHSSTKNKNAQLAEKKIRPRNTCTKSNPSQIHSAMKWLVSIHSKRSRCIWPNSP